jgi:predicted SprT family Zn-dependent metalloprotease
MKKKERITFWEYRILDEAYDFLNNTFFHGQLPSCMITLQRKANSAGYYSPERFEHRKKIKHTDEIALNPAQYHNKSDLEIISTLAHEMVHLWQNHFGNPGRRCYHNKEWAKKLESIGLMPSDTGEPGGKKTGQKMSYYIIPGGGFEREIKKFLAKGKTINWQSIKYRKAKSIGGRLIAEAAKPLSSKIKYSCPICKQNAWAKPRSKLVCGTCVKPLIIQI